MKFDTGYYTEFRLPEWFDGPENLKQTLQEVWNRQYRDLYERGGKCDVEAAFEDVLSAFGMPNDTIGHQRYVYMAYAMALAAKPTIEHYYPESRKFDRVQEAVLLWIKQGVEVQDNQADTLFPNINEIGRYQAADEAYNIFYGCLKTLDRQAAYGAILDILYDAMTGDAISGFAAAKRDMFNWWILEVVPSAYCLKLPQTLYSGKWEFPPLSKCA